MDISMETICDWLEGRLDADETARVATRVEQDRDLAARVEWLRRLHEDLPRFRVAAPPPDLRTRLEALFDKRESGFGVFKRYRAELVSDSWNGGLALGMRGGIAGKEARHMVYSCQLLDVSITLRQHPEHGYTELKGQVLLPAGLEPGLCSVELLHKADLPLPTEADDAGEFRFTYLKKGKYHLKILGPGFEVSTPEFDVH